MTTCAYQDNEFDDSRVAWFVTLERARADSNFRRAAEAQAQLERLGVRVKYLRQGSKKGKQDE